jgi:O-antigen/teichoic acid export membrane protein
MNIKNYFSRFLKNDKLVKRIGKTFVLQILGAFILFVSQVVLARVLGKDNYGIFSYGYSWLNLLIIPSMVGLGTLSLRYYPEFKVKEEWSLFKGLINKGNQVVFGLSFIITIIALLIVNFGSDFLEVEKQVLSIMLCALTAFSFINLNRFRLQALKEIVLGLAPQRIILPLGLIISSGVFYFFIGVEENLQISQFALVFLGLVILLAILTQFFFKRKMPSKLVKVTPSYETSKWLKVSLPLSFISSLQYLLKQTDILMLGILMSTSVVGLYNAAVKINALVLIGLSTINFIVAPEISKLYSSNKIEKLQSFITKSSWILFAITLLATVFILLFGKTILLLFGEEFRDAYIPLLILTLGNLINALSGSVGLLMSLTGHERTALKIIVVSVIINLIANYILIPLYGLTGAAIATAISVAIRNITLVIVVYKKLNINSTIFNINFFK